MAIKDLIEKAKAKPEGADVGNAETDPAEQDAPPDEAETGAEAATPGEEGADDGEHGNVSPEEQGIYDTVVIAASSMLYDPQTSKVIMQKLETDHGSPQVIGHTAAMIAISIREGARKQGKDIPPDVLFAAGQEIVANIIELAVAKGLVDESNQEEVFKQAVFEGLKVFGDHEKMTGQITPEVQQAAHSSLEQTAAEGRAARGGPGKGAVAEAMQKPATDEEEA